MKRASKLCLSPSTRSTRKNKTRQQCSSIPVGIIINKESNNYNPPMSPIGMIGFFSPPIDFNSYDESTTPSYASKKNATTRSNHHGDQSSSDDSDLVALRNRLATDRLKREANKNHEKREQDSYSQQQNQDSFSDLARTLNIPIRRKNEPIKSKEISDSKALAIRKNGQKKSGSTSSTGTSTDSPEFVPWGSLSRDSRCKWKSSANNSTTASSTHNEN